VTAHEKAPAAVAGAEGSFTKVNAMALRLIYAGENLISVDSISAIVFDEPARQPNSATVHVGALSFTVVGDAKNRLMADLKALGVLPSPSLNVAGIPAVPPPAA
jgi:hypothetical protein